MCTVSGFDLHTSQNVCHEFSGHLFSYTDKKLKKNIFFSWWWDEHFLDELLELFFP